MKIKKEDIQKGVIHTSILGDLFGYLRSPQYDTEQVRIKKFKKFVHIFKLWSLVMVAVMLIGILSSYLMKMAGIEEVKNSVVDLFMGQPLYIFLLLAVVWAPVAEEVMFRLGLIYSPYRLSFSLSFLGVAILASSIGVVNSFLPVSLPEWWFDFTQEKGVYIYLPLMLLVGYLLGMVFKRKLNFEKVTRSYTSHFGKIFYLSALVFGFLHIFNFYDRGDMWFLLPLLVLPQALVGVILGYIRMKYGFIWSVATHCLHNGMISIPLVLVSFLPSRQALESGQLAPDQARLVSLFSLFFLIVLLLILISVINLLVEHKRAKIKNKMTPNPF